MTTARTATRKPTRPTPGPASGQPSAPRVAAEKELTAGERLAADLRVLADIAASTPPITDELSVAFAEVTVVLRAVGGGVEVLAKALVDREAVEHPDRDPGDLFFAQRSWLLPHRAITLSAASLAVSVDDIEAAGR